MSLYSKICSDKKRRLLYKKSEIYNISLKYLVLTELTSRQNRYFYKMYTFGKYSKLYTQLVNRCIWTNKARWVLRCFKLSRMAIKDAMLQGLLVGVRKLV